MKKSALKNFVFKGFLILSILGFLWSCEEDEGSPTQPTNPNEDVYIAGGVMSPYYRQATYWKNGDPVILDEGPRASDATDIFIKGNNIYVVGSKKNEQYEDRPVLWENGVERLLNINGISGEANSIFVSDTIYIGGYESDGFTKHGKLWIFSNGWDVTSPNGGESEVKSVYVDQNNVYLSGYEYEGDQPLAKYWIFNSGNPDYFEEVVLEQPEIGIDNVGNSIIVKNNKIYVAGSNGSGATLWIDNVPTNLYPEDSKFSGKSIFIKDNDVYVAGTGGDITDNMGWYWKNGMLTKLSRGDAEYEVVNSIAVGEENVYVAGYLRTGEDDWAALWTNNNPEDLTKTKKRSWAHSVKVVEK